MRRLLPLLLLLLVACGRTKKITIKPHKAEVLHMTGGEGRSLVQRGARHVVYDPTHGWHDRADPPELWFAEDMTVGRFPKYRVRPDKGGYALFKLHEGDWHLTHDDGATFVAAVPSAETEGQAAELYAPHSPVVMGWPDGEVLWIRLQPEYTQSATGLPGLPSFEPRFFRIDFAEFEEGEELPPGDWRTVVTCDEANRRHVPCYLWMIPWSNGQVDLARDGYRLRPDRKKPARIRFSAG